MDWIKQIIECKKGNWESPGSLGQKIKKIRMLHRYTQKELGNILSYIDLISKSLGWSLDELMQKDSTDLKKRQENDETLEFDDSQEEQKSSDLTFASLKEYSEKVTKEAEERLGKSAMRDSVSYTYKK